MRWGLKPLEEASYGGPRHHQTKERALRPEEISDHLLCLSAAEDCSSRFSPDGSIIFEPITVPILILGCSPCRPTSLDDGRKACRGGWRVILGIICLVHRCVKLPYIWPLDCACATGARI